MTPFVFEIRRLCGQTRYYPACPKSATMLFLAGRKMLTQLEIDQLRYAGFEFIISSEKADKDNGGEV